MNNKVYSIAIDGPSGAGKSSLAKGVASRLGFIYVDTGAIYRTVGLAAQKRSIGSKDTESVEKLLPEIELEIKHVDGQQCMFLWGEDVSDEIRTPTSSIYASDVSAMPAVRGYLLEMQREMARRACVIMDGRDIGTVVLPDADLKIFLTASSEERAKRRYLELQAKGDSSSFEEVLRDIRYRDEQDSGRAVAPLKPADDSIVIDNSDITLQDGIDLLCKMAKERFEI